MKNKVFDGLPRRFVGKAKYYSQLDNDADWNSGPWNECSFSAMAAALSAVGFVGDGSRQFDDQVERLFEKQGFHRGSPEHMSDFMRLNYAKHGLSPSFSFKSRFSDVVASLKKGCGVILHTDLTRSGHVIALNGWDLDAYGGKGAFLCHDPNGEWFPSGYRTDLSGENVPYSFSLIDKVCGPDGGYWLHSLVRG